MPDDQTEVQTDEVEDAPVADPVYCRHCGEEHLGERPESGDFLCDYCERYQDMMSCPTCHQPARISMVEPDYRPQPVAPKRGKKSKE